MTRTTIDTSLPCSEQSTRSGEPLSGTATANVDVWLLLEHRERWEASVADTPLPAVVRRWLDELTDEHARLRVQLVRREGRKGSLNLLLGRTGPARSLYRFKVGSPEAFARIDVEGIIQQGDAAATAQGGVRLRSTWLVCTHGRRDRCCAQAGAAFVKAMAAVTPDDELWESSHLGGHRFAPSVLHLPSGVQYGRLREADAAALVEAHARDHVFDLAYYRGLTHLSREAQAAEAWLREHVGEPRIDGIQVLDEAQAAAGGQTTRLRTLDGQVHRVTVALRQGRFARLAGCDRDKPVLPEWFEPVRHEAYTSGP